MKLSKKKLLKNLKGGMKGKKHSKETKEKMRLARMKRKEKLGYLNSPETRKKMSLIMKNRKFTEETKRKMSLSAKGKIVTEETKKKMSLNRQGEKSCNWKGGRLKHCGGYIMIYKPEHHRAKSRKYVFEHIIVWEEFNKKILPDNMSIHHLNGIKDDNRPENLVAMKKGEHIHQGKIYGKRIRELEIQIKEWHEKGEEK